ncbi:MAG: sulfatase [Planctomycetota bacterium]|jgi:arylsulfatase A-like enzyme
MRRWTQCILLLLAACSRETPPPNVLLVTLDTTRADHLSCYGHERSTSPNLDRLATEGVLFRDVVNVSSWTLPSHASLLTGLYPRTHGAHYDRAGGTDLGLAVEAEHATHFKVNALPEQAHTLAEVLRDAGWATCGIGAGPWLKPAFGLAQGFEIYDSETDSLSGRPASEVNALALPFLRRVDDERPFFLFLNYFDPHDPYEPPPGYAASPHPLDRYDGEIRAMDDALGEILGQLEELGVYDETWIVVITDHGESFGEHGTRGHGATLWEAELRGALVVKPPRSHAERFDPAASSQQVDVMPTLLSALGIEAPAPMDGRPFGERRGPAVAELFENEKDVHYGVERRQRHLQAVYADGHKLILSSRADDPDTGLFDLRADPGETVDLRSARPDLVASMLSRLDEWGRELLPPLVPRPVDAVDEATREQLRALGYLEDR